MNLELSPARASSARLRRYGRLALLCALLLAGGLGNGFSARPVHAGGSVTVTSTGIADSAVDGKCDLYEALNAVVSANLGGSGDYHECSATGDTNVIVFSGAAANGTITIPFVIPNGQLPFVWGDTTIMGPITIDGNSVDEHLFELAGGATLTLNGVTVKNVRTGGGGAVILNQNFSTVNLIDSIIQDNTGDTSGALDVNGPLNVLNSKFINNQSLHGHGGALTLSGTDGMHISASTFSGNQAELAGGAIYLTVSASGSEIDDSTFASNEVISTTAGMGGGAIFSFGAQLGAARTQFNTNGNTTAAGNGGAVYNSPGTTTYFTDTVFSGNNVGSGRGGGFYNQGFASFIRSSFINNQSAQGSGGGFANDAGGQALLGNVTFSANTATNGFGGGIYNYSPNSGSPSTLTLRNVTLKDNDAKPGFGGAIGNDNTFAVNHVNAGNTAIDDGGKAGGTCNLALTTQGHNVESANACGFSDPSDQHGSSPQLGPLDFNGGNLPTLMTHLPLPGSPLVDHGDPAFCSAQPVNNEDETAGVRPVDGNADNNAVCDVGAVEGGVVKAGYSASPMPPGPINLGSAQIATTVEYSSFTVKNVGNITLTLSSPSMGNGAEFATTASFPLHILPNAQVVIPLSCTPASATLRSSTFSFNTNDPAFSSVSYNLSCLGTAVPAPSFSSQPSVVGPIDFGQIVTGTVATKTLVLNNTGTASLALTNNGFNPNSGDFALVGSIPANLGAGLSVTLSIRCQPQGFGLRSSTLSLGTNDPANPTLSYHLSCFANPPEPSFLANTQNLGGVLVPSDLTGEYGVAVSPDSRHVYVSGGSSAGGQVFLLQKSSGGLLAGSYLWINGGVSRSDMSGAQGVAVSPDGNHVAVAAFADNDVVVFDRDSGTGGLFYHNTFHDNVGLVRGLGGAAGVAFSPDSADLYATGQISNAVVHMRSNGIGYLFDQVISSTTDLKGAHGITLSPDGKNVYVTGLRDNSTTGSLAVYARNAANGRLTHLQTRTQGDCVDAGGFCFFPLNGLKGALSVAVSPDGNNVYVAAGASNALVIFARNAISGTLSWRGTWISGSSGSAGFTGADSVAVTPDGLHVLVTGFADNGMQVFDRDPADGGLKPAQLFIRNSGTGTPALGGVRTVAVSPDGQYAFTAASTDNDVAVFRVANPVPALTALLPASTAAGGGDFILTVSGAGFAPGASVLWNGVARPTTYDNGGQVRAAISASDITGAGTKTIQVSNTTPGGGVSLNALSFSITSAGQTATPAIDHLLPQSVLAGSGGLTLNVYGASFAANATVQVNGANRTTTFQSSTHLQASLPAGDTAQPGQLNITVFNPGSPGKTSGSSALTVAAPGNNPLPSLASLSPNFEFSPGIGALSLPVNVSGSNFVNGAVGRVNGTDRATKFINANLVQVTLNASDQLSPASLGIVVVNPTPGGGASNPLTFLVKPLHRLLLPLVRR